MKIVATSDTHFPFTPDQIPEGDVFIHAGDLMLEGTVKEWHSRVESLAALPHKRKILVPGNHDFFIEQYRDVAKQALLEAGVYLMDTLEPHDPYTLYGVGRVMPVPCVTGLLGWAYNRAEEWLADALMQYPQVELVIAHSPPHGVLDTDGINHNNYGTYALAKYIKEKEPKMVICGHVHGGYGVKMIGNTTVYNVSMCDEQYKQVNPPMVIEL